VLFAGPARAGGVEMEATGCAGLNLAETERLLAFELAIVAARAERARAPLVKITCSENLLTVRVRDPVIGRSIEQTMPAPRADEPGRERVIALAASQVLLNGWIEMVLEPAPAREPAPAKAPPAVERAGAPPVLELGFSPSARSTIEARRTMLFEPRLRLDVAWEKFFVGALAFFDAGTASRAPGDVRVAIAGGGVGAGVTLRLGSGWFWSIGATAAAGWVHLSAAATDPAFRATTTSGALWELALETGPRFEVERWRFGVEVGGGVTLPTVVARVDGDANVVVSGPWLRAGLAIARRFGGP
jgi:hypothetical protein